MKITDIFKKEERTFSFEFFPPKDEISAVDFGINVGRLLSLSPSFVTVTYGAGGSTQERTFALVDYLQNTIGITCMAHYTCVNASKEKIMDDLDKLHQGGIRNLMLLRGDPPKGSHKFEPLPGGFRYASELIAFVRQQNRFAIGAAAYPEKHLEAASIDEDINNLKRKVEAGSDFLVTQMFFNNEKYFEFVLKAKEKGINKRIIPGLIPITNYKQVKKFIQLSNASLPAELDEKLETYQDDPGKIYQVGIDFAIKQACDLLEGGAPGIHFYTLNKSRAAVDIFESIRSRINNLNQFKIKWE